MSLEVRFLTDGEITQWDDLVDRSPQGCIFCQSWWIKAACGKNFKVLGCFDRGCLVAGIPLHFVRYGPFKVCAMPKLTQSWGPVLEPIEGTYHSGLSREMELLSALAGQLRRFPFFLQCFHHSLPNWLPFRWAGFRQTTIFTYILDDIADEKAIWSGFRKGIRWDIRRAERASITVAKTEPEVVLSLSEKTFARQRMKHPFGRELLFSLVRVARERGAGECYAAFDAQGRAHVADFVVWDRRYTYHLVGGRNHELGNSGANALLVWWEVRVAREHSRAFDFEGSDLQGVEQFFRGFGARQQPFNRILRAPLWARIALTARGKL